MTQVASANRKTLRDLLKILDHQSVLELVEWFFRHINRTSRFRPLLQDYRYRLTSTLPSISRLVSIARGLSYGVHAYGEKSLPPPDR
jgi:hypothetical protein